MQCLIFETYRISTCQHAFDDATCLTYMRVSQSELSFFEYITVYSQKFC